ncbi:glycoside hydrolase family 2 protein [Petrimonas sp.]|uniref:glycoside hydrolase family 2 protein n=1 Tax=Petrimonas sp. TaxID=2023866 RepID=UPI003F50E47E
MKKVAFILFITFIGISLYSQTRQHINLNNNWNFTPGYEVRKNISTEISLPHTWNLDALSGKQDYYRGFGNYQKTINIPEEWNDKFVFLRFGAVNHTASVFINGILVGEHFGGYTAFGFDISKYIFLGKNNTIDVRVSNALDLGIMPLLGDFNFYGGIYRDVEIIVLPKNHISVENYASNGIRIISENVSEEQAEITVQASVKGNGKLSVTLKDGKGKIIALQENTVSGNAEIQTIKLPFTIKDPRLWNGQQDPHLYTAEISFDNDKVEETFGLRYFSVDDDNQFWLNGKKLQLRGVGRHQDFGGVGNAIHRQQMQKDIELMLEMGVNSVRLTHYPHDPFFLDLCDNAGLIVWSEIPFVGPGGYRDKGFVDSKRFKENGRKQLAEMIEQLYNHPSIVMWGLFNELKEEGDNPVKYVKELNMQAKADDPTRLTVSASNQGGKINFITDLIGFNQYFGWYGGSPEDIGKWGKQIRTDYPKLKVGVSEYGAGASPYHQQDSLKKPDANSMWHPENWQTHFHEVHWREMNDNNYFWGTYVWVMFDFYAAHRTEGERNGINDKGLVSIDRSVKKDAFYFYKANWNNKDKFVYISERRNRHRTNDFQTIKVFSNTSSVELFLNGRSLGQKNNNGYGTYTWENVRLIQGVNIVEAVSNDKKVNDIIEIEIL